jgi:endonuclease/exonuclease/phosphatase family metal-dependent hydrolase
MVFRRKTTEVSVLRSEVVATGLGNIIGNKGGVIISLEVGNCILSVISCHLEAHQHNSIKRTKQFESILVNALQDDPDSVLFLGDFNFRVHLPRHDVDRMLKLGDHQHLLTCDEWSNLMESGAGIMAEFREFPINFAPTYKLDLGTFDKYDSSMLSRIPSWTDRILYWSKRGKPKLKCLGYDSVKTILVSDHLPVVAVFDWPLDSSSLAEVTTDTAESKVCEIM